MQACVYKQTRLKACSLFKRKFIILSWILLAYSVINIVFIETCCTFRGGVSGGVVDVFPLNTEQILKKIWS